MKRMLIVLAAMLLGGVGIGLRAQSKQIIGYYPSWKWRPGPNGLTPAKIPYKKLTVIDYAFFYPKTDGSVAGRDSVGDNYNLKGERDQATGAYRPGTALVDLAHKNGVKVMLSVGGWEDSENYPAVASSETLRARFAHSCVEQIGRFGFDGIDIDWEFPCLADHKGTPDDRVNYTKLMKATRDSLDSYGMLVGKRLLLTAALPALEVTARNFEVEKVAGYFDMLNVMTYDLNGDWDTLSGHNAPLYAPNTTDTLRNVDAAFRLFTDSYHISPAKVNLGVPFYGHTYKSCTALYAPHKGADTEHFSREGCFYANIVNLPKDIVRKWDEKAKVPYIVSLKWNTLISYDDVESVGDKAQYVMDHHACGLIIWEITGDYLPDNSTPLLDVINSKFKAASK